ncbi:MAG: hypothetical protein H2172_09995 [Opitutus sp.]|nr:hypothetical protein [Opitutus sp.]MCS6248401.1 hypothetical protein [Opitutus sp.]MCS6275439.1 hypothetical protein [Opitutus sp.]MCS6276681.1 hypothetical protein [Opitutus sp.]MCS6301670.1 hypothetical protein [Opitutus sp.]
MSTPALLAYAIATLVWFFLLVSGIIRGYRRQLTVFNSPRDCVFTALLIIAAGMIILPVNRPLPLILIGCVFTIAGTCLWLRSAHRTHPRLRDLGLAVLTKVSLVVIVGLCLAIVITSTARVLDPNINTIRRILNAAVAGIGLYASYGYIRMMSQLMPCARPLKPIPPKLSVWARLMTSP